MSKTGGALRVLLQIFTESTYRGDTGGKAILSGLKV